MNHEANHIPSDPRTQTGWSSLDGAAHLASGHACPWPCCGWLAIGESTTHPPTSPNSPSYPHTISGAPKLDKKKFQRYAYESNQGNWYKALRIGNYHHVLYFTQILEAALLLLPPDVSRGVVVSDSLHPSLVSSVLK